MTSIAFIVLFLSMILGYNLDKSPEGIGALFWAIGFVTGIACSLLVSADLKR